MRTSIVTAGRPVYGLAVGILMQSDVIVRLPGDVGNATTFDFPVRYALVDGVGGDDLKDPANLERVAPAFVEAAKQLERQGVRMLAAGCGFASILQPALSAAVRIPVLTSSLIQVPFVSRCVGNRTVGIITADAHVLDDRYFSPLGWDRSSFDVQIRGIGEETELLEVFRGGYDETELLERGNAVMARVVRDMVQANPGIAAMVLECTNLPPFAASIQAAARLPVFDILTLIKWGYGACVREPFKGYC